MKIIQSYWSSPTKTNDPEDNFGRNNGGWLDEKYHAMSWALSCLKFRQFYNDVELHTDSIGYDWLINKLQLPYSKVVKSLDEFDQHDPSLWALPKLNTFLQQECPFLHADGDIFIWKSFPKGLIKSSLFAQNIEYDIIGNVGGNLYIETLRMLENKSAYIPDFLKMPIEKFKESGRIEAFNMGIVGGQDVNFLKEYSRRVFDFLNKNSQIKFTGMDMNFIEQFFLYCLSYDRNLKVKVLFEEENAASNKAYTSMVQFNLTPIKCNYIHVIGGFKKKINFCKQVAIRLKYEFPDMYKHILSQYKEKTIHHALNLQKVDKSGNALGLAFYNSLSILKQLGFVYYRRSFNGFYKFLGKVVESCEDSPYLRQLSDVYQLEKFFYCIRKLGLKKIHLNSEETTKILNKLYNEKVNEFLMQKFTLNTSIVRLILVNYKYPKHIFKHELNYIIQKQNIAYPQTDIIMVIARDYNLVNTEGTDNCDILLSYFDENQINGFELIELVKKDKLQGKIGERNLKLFALSFITKHSLYNNYIIPVN